MTKIGKTEFESAMAAGIAISEPKMINGTPAVLVPEGGELELLDHLRDKPKNIVNSVQLHTPQSFVDYYNRFAVDASTVFVNVTKAEFLAVLDYNAGPNQPDWCNHRARLDLRKTVEWSAWLANNRKWQSQEEFGLFIEENVDEITEPAGAQMLEIALNLKAKTGINFRKSTRLDNGEVKFLYEETIEASAGVKGELTVPEQFAIGLRPFEGSDAYRIEAKLRYRIKEGQLALRYDLVRHHKTHEAVVNDTVEFIGAQIVHGQIIHGEL